MARIKLTISANAGGVLQLGSHRLLIDALHDKKIPGFSTLNPALQQTVLNSADFSDPELICVTHEHPDHHSPSLMERAKLQWPEAQICLPADILCVTKGDLQMTYIPLVHDGAQYAKTPHYGILLRWNEKHILIPGDCAVADEALVQAVAGKTVDLAILNFPWLTLRKGRMCLENVLQPKHSVFWHLPFAEDDVNRYRSSAESALLQYCANANLLYNPLQTIEMDI